MIFYKIGRNEKLAMPYILLSVKSALSTHLPEFIIPPWESPLICLTVSRLR